MTFKLRSGNKTGFKNMGSSPVKHVDDVKTGTNRNKAHADAHNKRHTEGDTHGEIGSKDNKWTKKDSAVKHRLTKKVSTGKGYEGVPGKGKIVEKFAFTEIAHEHPEKKKSPAKQKLNKGGEGQDQNKEFNKKGEHVGNWVDGKLVMKPGFKRPVVKPKKEQKDRQDPTWPGTDEYRKPEDIPASEYEERGYKKSPAKQTDTTYADGSKKSKREQDFSKRHTTEKATYNTSEENHAKQDPYWYKIDGKKVSKHVYIKYKNKPGNMEGGGKQTNNPDVYGRKASNFGRGPKTKK
jgi:hypothetical protein